MAGMMLRWTVAWALLLVMAAVGQSCVQAVKEDRFKPAQPSKALQQIRERARHE